MSETMPSHHSSDNPGSQWMMNQPATRDDFKVLVRDTAVIRERMTHLSTKTDVKHLYGISSVIAVAAVSIAIKLIFFGGN